jgi:ATP-dependent Lon protease
MNTPPDIYDRSLPLLPLRSGLVLPGSFVTLPVGRRRSRALANAMKIDGYLVLGVQKDGTVDEPGLDDLHAVGVLARVKQKNDRGQRGVLLLVEGVERVRLVRMDVTEPFLRVDAQPLGEINADSAEATALAKSLREQLLADGELGDRSFRMVL